MLAATFTGVDDDGDTYTIRLTGAGNMVVTPQDGGGIESIALSGTSATSTLSISVKRARNTGDGIVTLSALTHNDTFPLKSIVAPAVDLIGAGVTWEDASIGSIRFRDILGGADVTVGGTSADRTRFSARFISNLDAESTSVITILSRVESFTVASIFFASLVAGDTAGTIRVGGGGGSEGNASNFSISVGSFNPNTGRSVDSVYVKGQQGAGVWNFEGDVRLIDVGSSTGDLEVNAERTIDRFKSRGDAGGEINALSIRSVNVAGVYAATIDTTGNIDEFQYGVRSFYANVVSGGTITSPDQNLGSVHTRQWNNGGISANRLASFRVTGGRGTTGGIANFSGQINDVDRDNALGEFYVKGLVQGSTVRVLGNTRFVSVGSVLNFRFFAGVQASVSSLPESLQDFNIVGGVIKTFNVRGRFERDFFGDPIFGIRNIQVAAREIQNINFNGRIQFNNNGTEFGVVADRLIHMSYRVNPNDVVSIRNLEQPGSGQPFGRDDMIVFIL